MNNLFDLTGKVAVVVGVGGIGTAQALGFADCGADVVLADCEPEHLEKVAEDIRTRGRKALTVTVDVTQEQSVADMLKRILEVFPHIDILVNTAGINALKSADSLPIDEWQRVMDINVRGTFLCCQAVGRVMIKQGSGKIINVSSVRGRYGVPRNGAAYCASKGAVDALTRTLACEWAKNNVLVNAIAPTMIETDHNRARLADPKAGENLKARIPLGRWGQPEDIVGPTVFLSSKASDFVTGQILYIDGGLTTWV